jgi:cytochrome c553
MNGVLPDVPGLLGLPRDYLVAQLGAWRTGHREAAAPDCMAQIARRLTPEDIGAVASWLAAQPLPADAKAASRLAAKLPLDCGSITP